MASGFIILKKMGEYWALITPPLNETKFKLRLSACTNYVSRHRVMSYASEWSIVFKFIIQIKPMDLAVKLLSGECLTNDKSTLVQIMACHQLESLYMSQCCPSSLSPHVVNSTQRVKLWQLIPQYWHGDEIRVDIWNHWHSKCYDMDTVYGSNEIIKIHILTGFTMV